MTLEQYLRSICSRRGDWFILEGISHEFYLLFDTAEDADNPKPGTCDIYAAKPGSDPQDDNKLRIVRDANINKVQRFLRITGL
jgi:hypothetical protein